MGFCPGVGDKEKQATGSAQRRALTRRRERCRTRACSHHYPHEATSSQNRHRAGQGDVLGRGCAASSLTSSTGLSQLGGPRKQRPELVCEKCTCRGPEPGPWGSFHSETGHPQGIRAKQRHDVRSQGPLLYQRDRSVGDTHRGYRQSRTLRKGCAACNEHPEDRHVAIPEGQR